MNKSKIWKNVIFGFGGQFFIIILGIIVPRIILTNYGSDVNGLLSTVTQIFTYMALLEAGINQAARNALYKPLAEGNREGVSFVASVAQNYFRKITIFYGMGVLILACIVPFALKSNVDRLTIFLVVLFEGMSGVVSFYFIQTSSTVLSADGRGYINNSLTVINKVISYGVKLVMASLRMNVAFLQFVYFLITIGKVIFYEIYFKKNYSWINYKAAPKGAKLKDRNSYIITEIAWTIFSSTDMIILSIFISTQMSSVYAIYNLVFTNINVLLNVVYSSVNYMLGHTFHEDFAKYEKMHDAYTSMFLGCMTILMVVSYILIIPFIELYTRGVDDIEYIYTSLPLMFCMVQILSWSRYVSGNLTGIAGYAKETSKVSLIEAIINIVLSLILVNRFGIVGVLAATVIALPLKVVYCAYISDIKVMHRSLKKTLSILGINYLYFALAVFCAHFIHLQINNYSSFILYGVIIFVVCGVIGMGVNFIINPFCLKLFKILLPQKRK